MSISKPLLTFGIVNIDKPQGPTSFTVSHFVKKNLSLSKTSHMGTLDPKVTGVLPITLGRACRLAGYLIGHDKEYVGVLETHTEQDIKKLQDIVNKHFVGKIKQTPPHRSAVKREERTREVYSFTFTEASVNKRKFLFQCIVQGGTYIRKICSDLGEMIGGAHMAELRRTKAGFFDESTCVTLDEFENAVEEYQKGKPELLQKMVMPAETVIQKVFSCLQVHKQAVKSLYNGKPLFTRDLIEKKRIKKGEVFALFQGETFIGLYKKSDEELIFARPEFVYG